MVIIACDMLLPLSTACHAELAHHQEEQARLAEEIRRQEDKLHGYQSSYHSPSSHHHHMGGGGGYHLPPPPPPPPPPAPPQPLFSSGQSTGNMPRQEHPKTILPNPPGPPQGGGLMPPPFMPPFHPGIGSVSNWQAEVAIVRLCLFLSDIIVTASSLTLSSDTTSIWAETAQRGGALLCL